MKKQIDEILRRIEAGEATDDELRMAEQHLSAIEERLSSQIDDWASHEQKSRQKRRRVWLRHAIAAAACLLLLFSVTVWFTNGQQKDSHVTTATEKDTFDNPEDAAAETERALTLFSEAINKAINN